MHEGETNLSILKQNNQHVLTTAQLAESYGATTDKISYNFKYNENRYMEGKHYFLLTGEALKEFKESNREFQGSLNRLYLWTEKGAWLHAKSLNTDEAWDAYEMLVDEYYRIKDSFSQPMTQLEIMQMQISQLVEQEKRLSKVESRTQAIEQRQDNITEILSLNPTEWRKKVNYIINQIAKKLGGFQAYQKIRNESYVLLEERARCQLSIRLTNRRQKMALEGVSKSKIDKVNKMDVIADDARLTEIYLAIVKELAIKYGASLEVAE